MTLVSGGTDEVSVHPRRNGFSFRKLGLSLAVAALTCLAFEVGFRVSAARANRETLEVAFGEQMQRAGRTRVGLIDIIRPSGNDKIVYELIPGLDAVDFKGAPLSTDSLGFRGPDRPQFERDEDAIVIFGLGDSVLFGHGIADGESYVSLLEGRLNALHSEHRWRTYNSGVPGYNTVQEVATLEAKGLPLAPDLVLLDLVPNDLGLPPYIRSTVDAFDLSRSFLFDFFTRRGRDLFQSSHDAAKATGSWDGDQDLEEVPERYRPLVGRDAFEAALDRLVELSEQHDFELLAFTFLEFIDPTPHLIEAARSRGIPVISLMELQQDHIQKTLGVELSEASARKSTLVVSMANAHPSAVAHRLAVKQLLRGMHESGLVARLKSRK